METQSEWDYLIIKRGARGAVNRIELLPRKPQLIGEVNRDPETDLEPDHDLYRAIAIAGEGGWELVSVENGIHYFKRPVPQSAGIPQSRTRGTA